MYRCPQDHVSNSTDLCGFCHEEMYYDRWYALRVVGQLLVGLAKSYWRKA